MGPLPQALSDLTGERPGHNNNNFLKTVNSVALAVITNDFLTSGHRWYSLTILLRLGSLLLLRSLIREKRSVHRSWSLAESTRLLRLILWWTIVRRPVPRACVHE